MFNTAQKAVAHNVPGVSRQVVPRTSGLFSNYFPTH
jgi:hypothetical protein